MGAAQRGRPGTCSSGQLTEDKLHHTIGVDELLVAAVATLELDLVRGRGLGRDNEAQRRADEVCVIERGSRLSPRSSSSVSTPLAWSWSYSASAFALTSSLFGFSAQIWTWNGAMDAGQIGPYLSWHCSMTAAIVRPSPIP